MSTIFTRLADAFQGCEFEKPLDTHIFQRIPSQIPTLTCEYCEPDAHDAQDVPAKTTFDENGFPIPKPAEEKPPEQKLIDRNRAPPFADFKPYPAIKRVRAKTTQYKTREIFSFMDSDSAPELRLSNSFTIIKTKTAQDKHCEVFRFMDLPPELRYRIYDYVFVGPSEPVCISDLVLRKSANFKPSKGLIRTCTAQHYCAPCQLHQILGTANSRLSLVSQTLHHETRFVPYTINTFSTHNIYYLSCFLNLIGEKARTHLRSLRFVWRLPQEEAQSLRQNSNSQRVFTLLRQCATLKKLDVELDVDSLLKWGEDGVQRRKPFKRLDDVPYVKYAYIVRGLTEARVSWRHNEEKEEEEDEERLHKWVCYLIGHWRIARDWHEFAVQPVKVEAQKVVGKSHMKVVHWKAGAEVSEAADDDD